MIKKYTKDDFKDALTRGLGICGMMESVVGRLDGISKFDNIRILTMDSIVVETGHVIAKIQIRKQQGKYANIYHPVLEPLPGEDESKYRDRGYYFDIEDGDDAASVMADELFEIQETFNKENMYFDNINVLGD